MAVGGPMLDDTTAKAAIDTANARDFDQTLAEIAKHKDAYESLLAGFSDADFQAEFKIPGNRTTRGAFIIKWILCGCAMYRTQLFLYLKACGREELGTTNLFMGIDAPAAA